MKRFIKSLVILIVLVVFVFIIRKEFRSFVSNYHFPFGPSVRVPEISCPVDKDNDGVNDLTDFVMGARAEVIRKPEYRSTYYKGGYPPETEGVCTDVVWRAMLDSGYDLKSLVDKDIRDNLSQYPRVSGKPDPNIDFRRVPNLIVFLRRNGKELTKEIKPGDVENLYLWQPGDIVTFDYPHEHIAIISDKRRPDGIPYILHNAGPTTSETDQLQSWPSPITGHFRFPRF